MSTEREEPGFLDHPSVHESRGKGGTTVAGLLNGAGASPLTVLVAATCIVIVLFGMRLAADILSPFLLALFLSIACVPATAWLRSRGAPRWLAGTLVLTGMILAIIAFGLIVGASLVQLRDKLPEYQQQAAQIIANVEDLVSKAGVDVSGTVSEPTQESTSFTATIGKFIGGILGAISSLALVLFIISFMMADAFGFPEKLRRAMGEGNAFSTRAARFSREVRSFLVIKGWLGFVAAIPNTLIYFLFGVDFALLWGIVYFLLSFIPNIGYLISIIPPTVLCLLEFGWQKAALLLAINLVINTAVDSVIGPRIIGHGLGLSGLTVFLSLVLWSWVLGPVGALLSVPMTIMLVRLFLDAYPSTAWLGILMSAQPRTEEVD